MKILSYWQRIISFQGWRRAFSSLSEENTISSRREKNAFFLPGQEYNSKLYLFFSLCGGKALFAPMNKFCNSCRFDFKPGLTPSLEIESAFVSKFLPRCKNHTPKKNLLLSLQQHRAFRPACPVGHAGRKARSKCGSYLIPHTHIERDRERVPHDLTKQDFFSMNYAVVYSIYHCTKYLKLLLEPHWTNFINRWIIHYKIIYGYATYNIFTAGGYCLAQLEAHFTPKR
jgi:hypothetical protein